MPASLPPTGQSPAGPPHQLRAPFASLRSLAARFARGVPYAALALRVAVARGFALLAALARCSVALLASLARCSVALLATLARCSVALLAALARCLVALLAALARFAALVCSGARWISERNPWWNRWDSNPQFPGCKPDALPNELLPLLLGEGCPHPSPPLGKAQRVPPTNSELPSLRSGRSPLASLAVSRALLSLSELPSLTGSLCSLRSLAAFALLASLARSLARLLAGSRSLVW